MPKKKKWWEDLPKVEDSKSMRAPIGIKPSGNDNDYRLGAGLGVEYTGAGEDGIVQTDMPTELIQTTNGARTIHEGEAKVENEDGSITVVPQDRLADLEDKKNIQGYQTGGTYKHPDSETNPFLDDKIEASNRPAGSYDELADTSPYVSSFNTTVTGDSKQGTVTGLNLNPAGVPSEPPKETADPLTPPDTTKLRGIGDTIAETDYSVDTEPLTDVTKRVRLAGVEAGKVPEFTQKVQSIDPATGQPAVDAEGNPIYTERLVAADDIIASIGDEIRNYDTDIDVERSPLFANVDKDSAVAWLQQAGNQLQDYMAGGTEADQKAANIAFSRFDASASMGQKMMAMRIAGNPNLTQGGKTAAIMKMNRDNNSKRAMMAGDLALAASERAFEATKEFATLSGTAAALEEDKYRADLDKAITEKKLGLQALVDSGTMYNNAADIQQTATRMGLDALIAEGRITSDKLAIDQANKRIAFDQAVQSGNIEMNALETDRWNYETQLEQTWDIINSMKITDPVGAAQYASDVLGIPYDMVEIENQDRIDTQNTAGLAVETYLEDFTVSDLSDPEAMSDITQHIIESGYAGDLGFDTSTTEGMNQLTRMITRKLRKNDSFFLATANMDTTSLDAFFPDGFELSPQVQAEIRDTIRNWDEMPESFRNQYGSPEEYEAQMILEEKRAAVSQFVAPGVITYNKETGLYELNPQSMGNTDSAYGTAVGDDGVVDGTPPIPVFNPVADENSIVTPDGVRIPNAVTTVGEAFSDAGNLYRYRGPENEPELIELTQDEIYQDPFSPDAILIANAGKTGSLQYDDVIRNQIDYLVDNPLEISDKLTDPNSNLYKAYLNDPSVVTEDEYSFQGGERSKNTGRNYIVGLGRIGTTPKVINIGGRLIVVTGRSHDSGAKKADQGWKYKLYDPSTKKSVTIYSNDSENSRAISRNDSIIRVLVHNAGIDGTKTKSPHY